MASMYPIRIDGSKTRTRQRPGRGSIVRTRIRIRSWAASRGATRCEPRRRGCSSVTDVIGLPNERGGRYFFEKRRADQDLSVLYVREGAAGENQVLLDPHPLSDDHTVSAEYSDIAADGTLLAYAVRTGGVDEVSIRLTNVDTREDLADALPTARYGGVWITPDKRGFFYERYGDVTPRVMFHELGTDIADDRMIFGEGYQVASDFCRGTVRRRTLAAEQPCTLECLPKPNQTAASVDSLL